MLALQFLRHPEQKVYKHLRQRLLILHSPELKLVVCTPSMFHQSYCCLSLNLNQNHNKNSEMEGVHLTCCRWLRGAEKTRRADPSISPRNTACTKRIIAWWSPINRTSRNRLKIKVRMWQQERLREWVALVSADAGVDCSSRRSRKASSETRPPLPISRIIWAIRYAYAARVWHCCLSARAPRGYNL
jgi:hypothetical protein